jgi:polyhydroxyalkanoate synthesis regulator phasin
MMTDVRKLMEGAVEKLSPAKAQEIARSLVSGGGREQVTKTAHELMEWSNKNRERIKEVVQREVRSQLKSLGVATRDEVDALKKRVRELERAAGPASKRPAAKKSAAKKSAAKKPSA